MVLTATVVVASVETKFVSSATQFRLKASIDSFLVIATKLVTTAAHRGAVGMVVT